MKEIAQVVESYKDLILEVERFIWKHPETGYREVATSNYMAEQFTRLGYKVTLADGITGFYTVVDTGRPGPEILVLGELDSIICPDHKDADPVTGAVHSCGHNAQCAALVGIAAALTEQKILDKLCGRIRLCAVPAEELLEIGYRTELKKQGKIKYYGGKSEFLSRGYFDGVDIAFMVHTSSSYLMRDGSVGCLAKEIIYKGEAAHAGGTPWLGKNALYAATCGINAVNAIRETFKEDDLLRFHPIITHGGDMVNAIPEKVKIETYVRGKSYDAILETNKKVNRALCGAALSLGTNIEIIDIPGYAPYSNDKGMLEVTEEAFKAILPERELIVEHRYSTGSTDIGDLSCIMPIVHPYAGGARGKVHGNDYEIYDPQAACVDSAKWQLAMLKLLLQDNALRAKKIIQEYKPLFPSKEAFLSFQDALECSGDRILYHEDGRVEVKC